MSENAHALDRSLRAKQESFMPAQVNMKPLAEPDREIEKIAPRTRDTMDEQFPTNALGAQTPQDRVMAAKLALSDGKGNTPFGKLQAKPSDWEWLQKKAAAAEAANFQVWFAKNFDHMSPAEKKWAREKYPEFYKQREKTLKQNAKNLVRLARIKLEGVQNKEDLQTLYLAETGRLNVGPLTTLLNPEATLAQGVQGKESQQRRFTRGLLSPFRFFGQEAVVPPNTTGFEIRVQQQGEYDERAYGDNENLARLGLGTGISPWQKTNDTNQGDMKWFEALQKNVF